MLGKLLATSVLVVGLAGLASCGGGGGAVDCSTVTTAKTYTQVKPILDRVCSNCHSSTRKDVATDRHGATIGYDYDTFEGAQMGAALGGADIGGTGANVMPPIGQNCPAAKAGAAAGPKCAVDGGGAVPPISDAESTELQEFFCKPAP